MNMKPDRRLTDRCQIDRRRSARWKARQALPWRMYRGRRTRQAVVVERSLDGLVMLAKKDDLPAIGARIHPANADHFDRFGFKTAVVRGIASQSQGEGLIFAEFEA